MVDSSIYFNLRQQAKDAIDNGRLLEARQYLAEALAWAKARGTRQLIDQAIVAHAGVSFRLGAGEDEIPLVREVVLRRSDINTSRLAAYNLSFFYELGKDFKKSLFYARIARDCAEIAGNDDHQALSLNQMGNALLGDSLIDEAFEEYEKALRLVTESNAVTRALILQNLGYCHVVKGRFREGYTLLFQSLRIHRRLGTVVYLALLNIDLSFAHLETGHFRHARRRGLRALSFAEGNCQPDAVKSALYLLGEASMLEGEKDRAREYFERLQRDYFPEAEYLPNFLMAVDVRGLLNLHA
jgi:tetratricopeptide (TPR) repeat protein